MKNWFSFSLSFILLSCWINTYSSVVWKNLAPIANAQEFNSTKYQRLKIRIQSLLDQGNYIEGSSLLEQWIISLRQSLDQNDLLLVDALNKLGEIYYLQGKFNESEENYQNSIEIIRKSSFNDVKKTITTLNGLSLLYQAMGKYEKIENIYIEILEIIRKSSFSQPATIGNILNNLGALYISQGRNEDAEKLFLEVLNIRQKASPVNYHELARSMNNLGIAYMNMERYIEAEKLYNKALKIREDISDKDHPITANSLNSIGSLYYLQEKYKEARIKYEKALEIRRIALPKNHPDIGVSLNNLGSLYSIFGRFSEAEDLYKEALAIKIKSLPHGHPHIAIAMNNLAKFYWALGKVIPTLETLSESLALEEISLVQNLTIGSEQQKRAFLALYHDSVNLAISIHQQIAPKNLQAAQLSLTTVLRRKGRILDVLSKTIQRSREISHPIVNAQLTQLSEIQSRIAQLTYRHQGEVSEQDHRNLEELQSHQQALIATISAASVELKLEFESIRIQQVQKSIPKNATLIEFIIYHPHDSKPRHKGYSPRYAAYTLTSKGDIGWADLGLVKDLDPLIQAFIDTVQDKSLTAVELKTAAQALDTKLMAPVRQLLGPNTQHLLVAPDGQLNRIPFEALMDSQGQYLLQRYQVTYLTSGRDLLRLQNPLPQKTSDPLLLAYPAYDKGSPTLVASNPTPQQRSTDLASLSVKPLPATLKEGLAIAQQFPQFQFHQQAQATETKVKQMPNPKILHIATHGFFLEDIEEDSNSQTDRELSLTPRSASSLNENPLLRSGLALAGFNQRQQTTQTDDGVLTALEISGLDLRGTQMVVMSACETGVGKVQNGDGIYGLRRAFTLAGARSQLMSLWTVDDSGTKDMMIAYYQRLKAGEGRAQAFRAVQLDMLEGRLKGKESYRHPAYWASFVRIGEWGPLKGL